MSAILKGNRFFVDTEAFRRVRFNFAEPSFAKIREICQSGELQFLTTEITLREIDAHVEEISQEVWNAFTKAQAFAKLLGGPDIAVMGKSMASISQKEVGEQLRQLVRDFFEDCSAKKIPLPKDAVASVFNNYFSGNPPFGEGKKKSEFPDAFVFEALKSQASNDHVLSIISGDKDLANACKGNQAFEHFDSLARFLNRFNEHSDLVTRIRSTLRHNSEKIDEELEAVLWSLPAEVGDCSGTARLTAVKLKDILDTLIISSEGGKASVEFVCWVDLEAMLDFEIQFGAPDSAMAFREEAVNITLQFKFDPNDPKVFEVESNWSPKSLVFRKRDTLGE